MQWFWLGRCSTCHNGIKLRYPVAASLARLSRMRTLHTAAKIGAWPRPAAAAAAAAAGHGDCRVHHQGTEGPAFLSAAPSNAATPAAHAAAWPPRWRFFSGRPPLFSSLEFDGAFPAAVPAWQSKRCSQCVAHTVTHTRWTCCLLTGLQCAVRGSKVGSQMGQGDTVSFEATGRCLTVGGVPGSCLVVGGATSSAAAAAATSAP
jgi:hypothetical protein